MMHHQLESHVFEADFNLVIRPCGFVKTFFCRDSFESATPPWSHHNAQLESPSCVEKAFFAKHWTNSSSFVIIRNNDGGEGRIEQGFFYALAIMFYSQKQRSFSAAVGLKNRLQPHLSNISERLLGIQLNLEL